MPPAKDRAKLKKPTLNELMQENGKLIAELDAGKAELKSMNAKWSMIGSELLKTMDEDWKVANNVQSDLQVISEETWLDVVKQVIAKRHAHEMSVAYRAEQLEKRVAEMSMDVKRAAAKCCAYDQGFDQLLDCDDILKAKEKILHLKVISGDAYERSNVKYTTVASEELFRISDLTVHDCDAVQCNINEISVLNLQAPAIKLSGETLMQNINPDVIFYIMNELNLEKASAADWRTLATRVGIPQEKVNQWKSAALLNPAGHVFNAWVKQDSETATVRLLHRHLASPVMRCATLCRLISTFYDIL